MSDGIGHEMVPRSGTEMEPPNASQKSVKLIMTTGSLDTGQQECLFTDNKHILGCHLSDGRDTCFVWNKRETLNDPLPR